MSIPAFNSNLGTRRCGYYLHQPYITLVQLSGFVYINPLLNQEEHNIQEDQLQTKETNNCIMGKLVPLAGLFQTLLCVCVCLYTHVCVCV